MSGDVPRTRSKSSSIGCLSISINVIFHDATTGLAPKHCSPCKYQFRAGIRTNSMPSKSHKILALRVSPV